MKSTAYIRYLVDVREVKFSSLEIPLANTQIDSLTLTMVDRDRMSFSFVMANPASLDEACDLTQEIAEKLLNLFAYYYNVKTGKLIWDQGYLEIIDKSGNQSTTYLSKATLGISGSITLINHIDHVDADFLTLVNLPSNSQKLFLCKQFRYAIQSEDMVSRYMFLYSILLQIHKDNQPKVDKFISTQDPTVEKVISPHTNKEETIYTKLRNEIAHSRKNTTLESTVKEIKLKVRNLQALTKKAIDLFT